MSSVHQTGVTGSVQTNGVSSPVQINGEFIDSPHPNPTLPSIGNAPIIGIAVQGPPGPQGPSGPQGPAGTGSGTLYTQVSAAATWIIVHGLGRPVIAQVYVSGEGVIADLITSDDNTLTVVFSSPQVGQVIYS